MAIHAGGHGDVFLFPQNVPLTHRAMTGFADRSFREVFLVTEEDVIRQAIDAAPLYRFVLRVKRRQALDGGALLLHRAMAAYALGCLRDGRKVSRLRDGVASLAVESFGDVRAMTEREGLFRRRRDVFWRLPEYQRYYHQAGRNAANHGSIVTPAHLAKTKEKRLRSTCSYAEPANPDRARRSERSILFGED